LPSIENIRFQARPHGDAGLGPARPDAPSGGSQGRLVGMGVDADVIAHRCLAFSNRIRVKPAKSDDSARIVGRTKTSSRFASPYLYGTKINLCEAPQS
jgi:hypothetical protein